MMAFEHLGSLFNRHEKIALMFSGGKDSLTVLELARPWWGRVNVVWVDTGAQLPEIHSMVEKFRGLIPAFYTVQSDQPAQIAEMGLPVDVLPVWSTDLGQAIGGPRGVKMQSWLDCCSANIWQPAYQFAKQLRVTAIIRGQRANERFTAPTKNGDILEGIELCYPIENWTKEEVSTYLGERGYEDPRLRLSHSSLDCWSCTAFVADTKDRLHYLKEKHPEKARAVYEALQNIVVTVQRDITAVAKAAEALR